jgi:hypothetical protein
LRGNFAWNFDLSQDPQRELGEEGLTHRRVLICNLWQGNGDGTVGTGRDLKVLKHVKMLQKDNVGEEEYLDQSQ